MTRRGVVVALCCVLWGCGGSDDESGATSLAPPDPALLFEPGPEAVGYRRIELSYRPPGALEDRKLPVEVWYPALASGEGPAEYAVSGIVSVPAGRALAAPALASTRAPLPVAIYSHGSGGVGLLAYPYGEHLASHGFVVLAPDHKGNTALDGFTKQTDPFPRIVVNRPADIVAVLDWLDASGDDPLQAQRRDTGVLLVGHSFGGYTTVAVGGGKLDLGALRASCQDDCAIYDQPEVVESLSALNDARIAALVPQAPALIPSFEQGSFSTLNKPTLLMSGRKDSVTTDQVQSRPLWQGLNHPDDLWVELPTGGHYSFISICYDLEPAVIDAFQPGAQAQGCTADFVPASAAVTSLAGYVLGFARAHILGESEWKPVLAGDPLRPEVVVTAR